MINGAKRRWLQAGLLLHLLAGTPVHADIWAFVDEQGVPHFASEQVEPKYYLFYRSSATVSNADSLSVAMAPVAPVTAVIDHEFQRRTLWLERLPRYRQLRVDVHEASIRHNIDPHLLTALIAAESGFKPDAVSPKGALGLMQVMPETADRYGVSAATPAALAARLFDPVQNLRIGARYLRDLLNLFEGSLELALAAYNAGEGAVLRAGNRVPAFRETQSYVRTVLQLYAALRPPEPVVAQTPKAPVVVPKADPKISGGALGRGNMMPPLLAAPIGHPHTTVQSPIDDERAK